MKGKDFVLLGCGTYFIEDNTMQYSKGVVVVVVVSHIQRIGCQPEKNYFARWPIPLVVC